MSDKKTTLEKIKKAALDEFSIKGFEGARIDSIAEKSGFNKAMIYYHFNGKEALYCEILSSISSSMFKEMSFEMNSDQQPDEKLYSMIYRFIDVVLALDAKIIQFILREFASEGTYFKQLAIPKTVQPVLEQATSIITEGKKSGTLKNELIPHYTMLLIISPVIFFNLFRITLEESDIKDLFFNDDYVNDFKENMISIPNSAPSYNMAMKKS